MDDLRKSIVGILSKNYKTKFAGTGFFVAGGLILTCAHVVDGAKKVNDDEIIFCLDESKKRYNAKVLFKSEAFELDIAILQPTNLDVHVPTLPLMLSRQSEGHEFKSFGYPVEGDGNGLHGGGKIKGWTRDSLDRDLLQISSSEITHGFSGCPIWDNQFGGVVGMVRRGFDFGLDKKLGDVVYAIPTEVIKMAYPVLKLGKRKNIVKLPMGKIYDEEITGNTIFKDGKIVQIIISQMFRMADLLTNPESVKAKKLYEIATDGEKCRRFLNLDGNGKKRRIPIEPYGYLTPVAVINDRIDNLWRYAKKDFRGGEDPLRFFPLELDLTEYLRGLGTIKYALLDNSRRKNRHTILNLQLNGGLRIYPPGTGIVRFSLTIEFQRGIELETMAKLAREIDTLLFVNPTGNEVTCPTVFMEIVETVAQNIFKKERYEGKQLDWQPTETTFCFRDFKSAIIDDKIKDLGRLMSYAPENNEKPELLQRRLERATHNAQWQKNRLIFAVGQGVALLFSGDTDKKAPNQLKGLFERLVDTRELIAAAKYAERAFAERVSDEYLAYKMHKKFDFEKFYALLFTMQRVLYATESIRSQLKSTGRGELMSFAQDIWDYGDPVIYKELDQEFCMILNWFTKNNSGDSFSPRIEEIKEIINQILATQHPISTKKASKHFGR